MNIFIDTQDMEERYAEELYKEYLENENKQLKDRIEKAIEHLIFCYDNYYFTSQDEDRDYLYKAIEILKGG